ncbi:MAG: Dabb family protein [Clostridiaceae bacterium]|jgi:hypothetical protein|nr:Dabb family protein [Clostridiaceae bacterium]
MWKLKEENKAENAKKIKVLLEGLNGVVPSLRSAFVGIGMETEVGAFDAVLISEFDDAAGLAAYKIHPEHVKISEFVKTVRVSRSVCDYII